MGRIVRSEFKAKGPNGFGSPVPYNIYIYIYIYVCMYVCIIHKNNVVYCCSLKKFENLNPYIRSLSLICLMSHLRPSRTVSLPRYCTTH